MNSFVYFDYCALIVEALIIVSLIIRKMTRGRVNRWAFMLIVDIVITTIADIAGLTLEAIGPGNIGWKYISNTSFKNLLYLLAITTISIFTYDN